jgi:selenocysteine-specific elongation factor
VRALTGVDTDRLPEERRRGISIELGYASLALPGGRSLSVVDVPGHEHFVRTMVAGASGVDLFLLVVAADDGVMPQTVEHADVLRALAVDRGVVAVTKSDLADPQGAAAGAAELLAPWARFEVVACSAASGAGVPELAAALERAAAQTPSRAGGGDEVVLHVDRSFVVRGAGTVVTGTLWSGAVARGDRLTVLPRGVAVRVRSVQVHDAALDRAEAGQRVALNLVGVGVEEVGRGDVVTAAGAIAPTHIVDAQLRLRDAPGGLRATIHHGTRETPGRLVALGGDWWQVRMQRPLLARPGDRVVVRGIAPPGTLGGGVVVDPHARRHGPGADVVARLGALAAGATEADEPAAPAEPTPTSSPVAPAPLGPAARELERRLHAAGHEPPGDAELGDAAAELPALVAAGRVVRIGRAMHAHVDAIAAVRERVVAIIAAEGSITVARLRDELGTSRKYALALLEHLDASRVTLRLPDDARVARRRR